MIHDIIASFNAGELSPYLESRTTLDKYRSGCKTLENYLITPYGPANRRSGTEWLGEAKNSDTRCRLFGLNLSDSNRIVMELGVGYMRFWKNGALMTHPVSATWNGVSYTTSSILEAIGITYASTSTAPVFAASSGSVGTPHPYTESDLRDIQIVQVNNVVYITHPSYVPMRLSYWGTNTYNPPFTIGEVPWKWAPVLDQNITSTTITPSAKTGSSITLTASSAIFKAGHVGSYWQIAHNNPTAFIESSLLANSTTATPITVLGKWSLQTFGTWTGTIELQQSDDKGTNWKTIRTYNSKNDYNAISSGENITTCQIRLKVSGTSTTGASTAPRVVFTPIDATLKGFVRVTGYTSSTVVTATAISDLGDTIATTMWSEGAFSAMKGFPNSCAFHESRIIFAGTSDSPSTIWGSYTSDFENFKQGAYDSDSYSFTLSSSSGGLIKWIISKTALLIGTTQEEWSLSSSTGASALTATNVMAKKQSRYGSGGLPALIMNDTVVYLQKMGRKLREFVYAWNSETWVSNDITALAEHTTRGGIVEVAYQRVPDALLWMVRSDGQLVGMTYEREQQVVGFSRHTTNGTFESVACINGLGSEDEVYVLVNRTIGGSTVRYIERFKTGMREALDTADTASWWYLDCAKRQIASTSTGKTTGISGTYTSTPVYDNDGVTIISYTVNVTSTGHGLSSGNTVRITSASSTTLLENFVVTVTSSNAFTLTLPILSTASGSLTFDYVSTTITGLSHLNGKTVSVWADQAVGSTIVTQPIVVSGSITLQSPASNVLVGIPFTSTLVPEQLVRDMQDGTSAGRRMKINKMNVKVYQSLAGEYSTDGVNWFPLVARHLTDDMDALPPVLMGYERVTVASNWKDGVDISLRQTLPMPLTIAAIVASWDSSEASQ
jgi:hypothetical protein